MTDCSTNPAPTRYGRRMHFPTKQVNEKFDL
jgi:hypothetical protein